MVLNKKISALLTRLCAVIVSLLGFSCSADEPNDKNNTICMYGTPTGIFEVKGKVTDENGKPVANATIRVSKAEKASDTHSFISVVSDTNGDYSTDRVYIFPDDRVKIVCLTENKTLENDSVIVNLDYVKEDNNDSWNRGFATATANFQLKKKTD